DRAKRRTASFRGDLGDCDPAWALQRCIAHDLVAAVAEISTNLGIGCGEIRREERNSLDPTVGAERRRTSVRAATELEPSACLLHRYLESVCAREAIEE